jgi:hypothetical protein
MSPWLLAVTVASASGQPVQIPGAPPLPPHMHYEIRINRIDPRADASLTDAQKLERACDLSAGISSRLQGAEKRDVLLQFYLADLSATACAKPKSK